MLDIVIIRCWQFSASQFKCLGCGKYTLIWCSFCYLFLFFFSLETVSEVLLIAFYSFSGFYSAHKNWNCCWFLFSCLLLSQCCFCKLQFIPFCFSQALSLARSVYALNLTVRIFSNYIYYYYHTANSLYFKLHCLIHVLALNWIALPIGKCTHDPHTARSNGTALRF